MEAVEHDVGGKRAKGIGGALDPAGGEPVPPAVDPLTRLILLARQVRRQLGAEVGAAESFRLAADLARTADALLVEEVPASRLADAVPEELAGHWQVSLQRLRALLAQARTGLGQLMGREYGDALRAAIRDEAEIERNADAIAAVRKRLTGSGEN